MNITISRKAHEHFRNQSVMYKYYKILLKRQDIPYGKSILKVKQNNLYFGLIVKRENNNISVEAFIKYNHVAELYSSIKIIQSTLTIEELIKKIKKENTPIINKVINTHGLRLIK